MKFLQSISILALAVSIITAQDFCSTTEHSGESVTETDINVGSIGDIGYEIWYQGGENSATFYEDGSFSCSFKKSKDYLCRSGLSFDSTQTHEEIGHLYADFKLVKQDIEDVDYSYIGIYGWSREPLIEYYVVDNWLSQYRPGDWVGEKKHGDFMIDGAEYTVYENTRYGPSIDGETTFTQFFSVRKEPRECGTIDITAHFKKWEELGMVLGKLHEAKVLGEAGSISDGTSGTADFPYAKVYIGEPDDESDDDEVEVDDTDVNEVEDDDSSEEEIEVDDSNVSEQVDDDESSEEEETIVPTSEPTQTEEPVVEEPTQAQEQPIENKDVIKIMPIGDSITFGWGEDGGYRKYLYNILKDNGYDNIDFVGPEGSDSATFEKDGKTITYDDNHSGFSGFTIMQQPDSWSDDSGLYEKLKSLDAVKKANPDIVLLIIGTNDMTANRSMEDCEADLHTLLDYILGDISSESIIIMGTIPEFRAYGGNEERVANYNRTVKKVAEDYANNGSNVKFADVHGCLNGMDDIDEDDLHPTGEGYEKMAKFWFSQLEQYLEPTSSTATTTTEVISTPEPTQTQEPEEPTQSGDFCSASGHSGESVTETDINVGSIGDIGYEIWYQGGENSATFYEDGSFSCSFKKSKDYLCRSGLSFDNTQTHEEIGHLYADFKLVKQDIEDVDYSYIGIYGWSREPLIEYYVVDNWLSQYRPGDWVGEKKHGDFMIDGAEYTVYENTRYGPSIDGETTFTQFFSIRKEARDCGTIDITAHFKKWEELGMVLGKLHEAKVLGEAGSIHDGTSGTADFPYAKVYIKEDEAEQPQNANEDKDIIKIMPIGDSITFGWGEDGGYRKYLYNILKDNGYDNIDFVGPEGSDSATFEKDGKTITYDDNHSGFSGFTIMQQPDSWSDDSGLYEKLKSLDAVKKANPDIVLLIIGTNDMTANRSMEDCEADLHTLLDYILGDISSESIIIMGTIPEFRAYGGNEERVANYNRTVKKVAEDYANNGSNVKFADVHGCLNGMDDIDEDDLHPTGEGYEKMAKFWFSQLEQYLEPTSAAVATTAEDPVDGCASIWEQCGGEGFNGPSCCSEGSCVEVDRFFSQCQRD